MLLDRDINIIYLESYHGSNGHTDSLGCPSNKPVVVNVYNLSSSPLFLIDVLLVGTSVDPLVNTVIAVIY